ncbi:hypothetical protein BGZ98_005328, partial [Dissophora globulifera]
KFFEFTNSHVFTFTNPIRGSVSAPNDGPHFPGDQERGSQLLLECSVDAAYQQPACRGLSNILGKSENEDLLRLSCT